MRVVDVCGFYRETVTIAFGLFDRFLSRHTVWSASALQDKSVFQLVAITSLYIAIKTNERVAVHSELFASISEGGYSMDDIEETEKIILFVLCPLVAHQRADLSSNCGACALHTRRRSVT
jgi:hypothetical protein